MGLPPFSHSDSALKIQKRRLRTAHCDNLAVCAQQLTKAEENIFKHGTPYVFIHGATILGKRHDDTATT